MLKRVAVPLALAAGLALMIFLRTGSTPRPPERDHSNSEPTRLSSSRPVIPAGPEGRPAPPTEMKEPQNAPPSRKPFEFDSSRPIGPQLDSLLEVEPLKAEHFSACSKRIREILPALLAAAEDSQRDSFHRENALLILQAATPDEALPRLLALARKDGTARIRSLAIEAVGLYGPRAPAGDLQEIFRGATTDTEKRRAVSALGGAGNASSLALLEEVARLGNDDYLRALAARSIAQIKVLNSAYAETDLVLLLASDDRKLRNWAVDRIAAGQAILGGHHLRSLFETERRKPEAQRDGSFEFRLLSSLQKLGEPLSPAEREFVSTFSFEKSGPFRSP